MKRKTSDPLVFKYLARKNGRNKLIKTIGCATERPITDALKHQAQEELDKIKHQPSLLPSDEERQMIDTIASLNNSNIQTIGPGANLGRIYDFIGFNQVKRSCLSSRDCTVSLPLSGLKTVDYVRRYQGIDLKIDAVYRFLDRLQDRYHPLVEQIAFEHTKRSQGGVISAVFYDMTTLHFESEDEDDSRRTGFSKVGKHKHPQIYLGLLVGANGYPIGYDTFEGKTYEGHTLILSWRR